jgi:hypothetical protein
VVRICHTSAPYIKNHLALKVGGWCSGPAPSSSLKNRNAKKPNTKPQKSDFITPLYTVAILNHTDN